MFLYIGDFVGRTQTRNVPQKGQEEQISLPRRGLRIEPNKGEKGKRKKRRRESGEGGGRGGGEKESLHIGT